MNRKQRRAAAKLAGVRTSGRQAFQAAANSNADELLVAGLQHHKAGRLAEAEQVYRRILSMDARHADSLHLLGVIAHQAGRHEVAVELINQAIKLRNDIPFYYNNRGIALEEWGKLDEAVVSYQRALTLKPDYAEAHCNLGNVLRSQGKLEESLANYQRALALKPDFAKAHNNLGVALRDLGKFDEAVASFQRTLVLKPGYAEAHHNMSIALRALGKLDEAQRASERAIELDPGAARYYFNLLEIKRVAVGDPHLAAVEELVSGASLPPKDRMGLHFALAKAYTDVEEHERAFRHMLEGNALKRRETIYDEAAHIDYFERVRDVFTLEFMRAKQGLGNLSAAPVFIVGMPRSGSTLVEQILASHPKVFGAGELTDFARIVASLTGPDSPRAGYPDIVSALTGEQLNQIGTDYLKTISAAAPGAERVTNKMPSNFFFAGLIHLALPNARIIHTRRDPLDTCISCFSYLFVGDQPFCYDLGELGRYYRAYESLMAHWREVLPKGVMLEVQYEEVVDDLEGQARRLISHCGLEWDDACLDFHKTQRPVWTASSVQVRQPVYKSSVGRWRSYENLLQPLIDALGPELNSH